MLILVDVTSAQLVPLSLLFLTCVEWPCDTSKQSLIRRTHRDAAPPAVRFWLHAIAAATPTVQINMRLFGDSG